MVALSHAHAALDALHAYEPMGLSDDSLLAYWREFERLRRRLPSVEHGLVLEAEARGLPETYQARSTATFLRGLLRLDPSEASSRVKAAHAAGPRRRLTGEAMPAIYPVLAAAQAAGQISERQARVVVDTIEKLPDEVRGEHGEQIERDLVQFAEQFDAINLAKLAERISAYYDPDGRLKDVDYREKHRSLIVQQRVDGSSRTVIEATAELTELLLTHLDALAKPHPEADGVKDPRTAEQRRHDAVLEALKLNLRAQQLPAVGGVTATIVMTMTVDEFEQRKGLARTGHGALVPVPEAVRIAGAEYRLMNVVIDKTRGVTHYSGLHRLHTEAQRLAMTTADGPGCTFPHCPVPAHWCEADHIIDFAAGGPTTVEHGHLPCRYHHRVAKAQGWRPVRINGRTAWVPPRWIDPEQKPQYNYLHNPDPPP